MIVNLTPHVVTLRTDTGEIVIPPSGQVARVVATPRVVGTVVVDGVEVPVREVAYGEVEGLPDPQEGVLYIVSSLVLEALRGQRGDLLAPDTSPDSAVRDPEGRIIAVRYLRR